MCVCVCVTPKSRMSNSCRPSTQPPQEILDAVQDGGREDMSESDDDGAMPEELRKVRFVDDDLDAAATLLQNSKLRTARLEVAQRRQINSAATLLQNSERTRTARVKVAQKRQKRDDSAATLLQGSIRSATPSRRCQKDVRVRDDGAATLLQGSVRRRNARAEVERRRAAKTEHKEWPAFARGQLDRRGGRGQRRRDVAPGRDRRGRRGAGRLGRRERCLCAL